MRSGTPGGNRTRQDRFDGTSLREVMEPITPANHDKTGTAVCADRDASRLGGGRELGLMNISVRYMRDFKRTYWCTLYLRRKPAMVLTSAGVLVLLAAFLPSRSSQAATVVLAVIGIVLLVEVPVVIWLMVRRNWDALNEEVEVTVTGEEVVQRTATTSLRLSWDMMQRIISLKDMWLFCVGRLKVVTLYKGALTAAQQAELAAFIEARKR
jgi:hypothetical protein